MDTKGKGERMTEENQELFGEHAAVYTLYHADAALIRNALKVYKRAVKNGEIKLLSDYVELKDIKRVSKMFKKAEKKYVG